MKRERSSERKSKNSSKRHSINASTSDYANECQWYDVWLELHIKSTYKLTSAINKSEDRWELPTVPQPTHTIEWLARTNFRYRPVHLNVPQQRKHNMPQERKHKVARRRCVQQLDSSFIVY
ncbi:uncharacterized protein [Magallana gigas]|uniref:uncharacterized protein isoform X2 n=1 Tax=Magallana gigas TaxID=29159 RepID=UPI00333FB08F